MLEVIRQYSQQQPQQAAQTPQGNGGYTPLTRESLANALGYTPLTRESLGQTLNGGGALVNLFSRMNTQTAPSPMDGLMDKLSDYEKWAMKYRGVGARGVHFR